MDRSENLGVCARHACGDAPLQGFEAAEDGWRLEDREQETQHFQSCANIPIVDLIRLLLEWRTQVTHRWHQSSGTVHYRNTNQAKLKIKHPFKGS